MTELPPLDNDRLLAWATANFDIPADVVSIRVGSVEGGACLWIQRPHPSEHRYIMESIPVAQFPSVEALRAAFIADQDGQMTLDLLG